MADSVPWGSTITVSPQGTASLKAEASSIAFADGSFLAIWIDSLGGGDVRGQFFSADGTHKGESFLVTSAGTGVQAMPKAALLSDGRYVVTWATTGGLDGAGDRGPEGVWMRIFDQTGQSGSDVYVGGAGTTPPTLSVSALGDGFVIGYAQAVVTSLSITSYVFDRDTKLLATVPQPNAPQRRVGYETSIVALDDGRYAVFSEGEGHPGDTDGDIRVRVISASGDTVVQEFRVSAPATGDQGWPSAARLKDGRIAVVWQHDAPAGGDGSGTSIRGRLLDPFNPQAGQEFQVNITTLGDQADPSVTALSDGGFAVAYHDRPDPESSALLNILIATFNADGTPRGEIRVTDVGQNYDPVLTELADGRLLVTWTADKETLDDADIRARIVDPRQMGVDLAGTAGNDSYFGSAFADVLNGAAGGDRLEGGAGNDRLNGGLGRDTMSGGAGDDVFVVDDAGDVIVEAAGNGIDTVLAEVSFSLAALAHVEHLTAGPAGAIALTGNASSNRLTGNADQNALFGLDGDDWLDGGAGADRLVGGTGADTLSGGLGDDTYEVDSIADQVAEAGGSGRDTVISSVSFTLGGALEIEALQAAGTSGLTLKGNGFANAITGNAGSNKLFGGLGNDQLRGEAGRDTFVFDTKAHASRNLDRVLDFRSKDDSFHLDNKVFTKLGAGTASKPKKFSADMFVEGRKAQDQEDRIVYDRKSGSLYYDQDGSGSKAQVKIATIANKTKLYYHDFFVI